MSIARLQALYLETLAKLEAAAAAQGPDYTLPGGASVKRADYVKELQEQLKTYAEMPGVVPELRPTFEVFG